MNFPLKFGGSYFGMTHKLPQRATSTDLQAPRHTHLWWFTHNRRPTIFFFFFLKIECISMNETRLFVKHMFNVKLGIKNKNWNWKVLCYVKLFAKSVFLKCKMLKNRAALDVSKIMSYRYSMLLGNK